jgi:hypothetical protein
MTSIKLIAKEDYSPLGLGLMPEVILHKDLNVASSGMLLAHDILEHQNGLKAIGSISDELQALGGIWFVRGRNGYLTPGNMHSPQEDIGQDIAHMAYMFFRKTPLRSDALHTHKHYEDESFIDILDFAKKAYKKEMYYVLEKHERFDPLDYYFEQSLHLMRTGYRKAEKRFKNICAQSLFMQIEEAVDNVLPCLQYEGQEIILTYTVEKAMCREVGERYY